MSELYLLHPLSALSAVHMLPSNVPRQFFTDGAFMCFWFISVVAVLLKWNIDKSKTASRFNSLSDAIKTFFFCFVLKCILCICMSIICSVYSIHLVFRSGCFGNMMHAHIALCAFITKLSYFHFHLNASWVRSSRTGETEGLCAGAFAGNTLTNSSHNCYDGCLCSQLLHGVSYIWG